MKKLAEYNYGQQKYHAYHDHDGAYVLAYYKIGGRVTFGKLIKGYGTYVIIPTLSHHKSEDIYTETFSMLVETNTNPDVTITIFRDTDVFLLDKNEVLWYIGFKIRRLL